MSATPRQIADRRSQGRHRRATFATILCAGLAASCNDVVGPVPRTDIAPRLESVDARNGGQSGFYFLPPLAPVTEYGGTFDPGRSPAVTICRMVADACGPTVATYTTGSGAAAIRVDSASEQYLVQWHSKTSGVEAGETYRVAVFEEALELGHVDVRIVRRAADAHSAGEGVIAIVAGATIPIKWRLETSSVGPAVRASIGRSGGDIVADVGGGAIFTLDVPEGALDSAVSFTVTPQPPANGSIGTVLIHPSNILFRKPVNLTFTFPGVNTPDLPDSIVVGLGTPSLPRTDILPTVVSGQAISAATPMIGNPAPSPLLQPAAAGASLRALSITDDEATAMAEAFIATVQARIAAYNASAEQLFAERSFEAAIDYRLKAVALAQYIGESEAASDAYAAGIVAACTQLDTENGLARFRLGANFADLWKALHPIITFHAAAGIYGLDSTCAPYEAFSSVVTDLVNEFTALYTAAMERPTFVQSSSGIRRELFKAVAAQVYVGAGFQLEMAVVKERIQRPLASRFRNASYAWCRTDFQQAYLGYLFRSARDEVLYHPASPDSAGHVIDPEDALGFTAGDVWEDIQYCGTAVRIWNRKESGVPTSHGPLGGGDQPGSINGSDSLLINPHGTVELDSLLVAYECRNEEFGNDRIIIRFNGQHVRYLDRIGATRHFIRNVPAVFKVDSLAHVGGVDLREGGTFPLDVLREGNACAGEYYLPGEESPNLLFRVNLRYPRIQVSLDTDSVSLEPAQTRSFTATVTGTPNTEVTWEVTGGDWVVNGNSIEFTAGNGVGTYPVIARSVVDTARADTVFVKIGEACAAGAINSVAGANAIAASSVEECVEQTIVVSPELTTVLPETTHQFHAAVTGGTDSAVTWTATGGTISPSGLFTAGSTLGSYIVIGRSASNPAIADTAIVHIASPGMVRYFENESGIHTQADVNIFFGPFYFNDQSRQLPPGAYNGSLSLDVGGGLVTVGDTRALAHAAAALNLGISTSPDSGVLFGSVSGSVTSASRFENGTGHSLSNAVSQHAHTFITSSSVKMQLIANGSVGGCPNINIAAFSLRKGGTTLVSHTGASFSVAEDLQLQAGEVYTISVSLACQTNAHTDSNGTFNGSGQYSVIYAFH